MNQSYYFIIRYNFFMKIELIEKALKIMSENIYKNSLKEDKGFPVSCVFVKNKENVCVENNKRSSNKETYYKNHAEYLCLEKIDKFKENIKILAIITLPPCSKCLEKIKQKTNVEWEIYYLNDYIREKNQKTYIKQNEGFIKKLCFSELKNEEIKLRFLYCVYHLIDGFLSHKIRWDQINIKEKVMQNKIEFKKDLCSLKISIDEISAKWLKEFYLKIKKCLLVK